MNDRLEEVPGGRSDPRCADIRPDVRLYDWCGGGVRGSGMAPCTLCEWSCLCPEYSDKSGDRPAGSGKN